MQRCGSNVIHRVRVRLRSHRQAKGLGPIRVILGSIGFIFGLYGENGKENGNYYNGLYEWLSKLCSLLGYPKY